MLSPFLLLIALGTNSYLYQNYLFVYISKLNIKLIIIFIVDINEKSHLDKWFDLFVTLK
jgi:hypothetical protein